jgi:hypothetical protein
MEPLEDSYSREGMQTENRMIQTKVARNRAEDVVLRAIDMRKEVGLVWRKPHMTG